MQELFPLKIRKSANLMVSRLLFCFASTHIKYRLDCFIMVAVTLQQLCPFEILCMCFAWYIFITEVMIHWYFTIVKHCLKLYFCKTLWRNNLFCNKFTDQLIWVTDYCYIIYWPVNMSYWLLLHYLLTS